MEKNAVKLKMSEIVEHVCRVLTLCDQELSKDQPCFNSYKASDREIRTFLRYQFPKFYKELQPFKLEPCSFLSLGLRKMSRLKIHMPESQRYLHVRHIVVSLLEPPQTMKRVNKPFPASEVGTYISETTLANQHLDQHVMYD